MARVQAGRTTRVGLISDTHGYLSDAALDALAGSDAIVHAGDVGGGHVLEHLRSVAPVTAVRGNCDQTGGASLLPEAANVEIGGVRFLVGHVKQRLLREIDPAAAGARVVVTGHSHRSHVEEHGGVLYVNPGSAGDDRGHGRSIAIVEIEDGRVGARIVAL